MMITIHGLPITTKYHDVKVLIRQQCNITDFILDSLVSENNTKKVRVGLADDSEGSHLIKCLDGFRWQGNILRVVPVGKASSVTPHSNTFEARGSYQQNEYSNQNNNERNRSLDASRPTNWAHNQWASNTPQIPVQNNYGYQQPVATTYGQPANTVIKPHFEPRDAMQSSRGPQQGSNYSYNPKSNLISLGPQNNIPSSLHDISQATNRQTPGRYPSQTYDISSDKPITIMKENFQGPNQYNLASSHNQNYQTQGQISPWANQQPQQKTFDKSIVTFDKKPYEERKYPSQTKHIQDPSKMDDSYKYDKSGRGYSPQRKDFRDVEERARAFKGNQYSDREERRSSPSNRNVPSGRHYSPNRQISPTGRHGLKSGRHSPPSRHQQSGRHLSPGRHGPQSTRLLSPGRQILPSGRISPQSGRHVPPGGTYVSPGRHVTSSGRQVSPSGRHVSPNRQMITDRKMSPLRKLSPRRDSPQLRREDYVRGRRVSPPSHSPMDRLPLHQSSDRDARIVSSHIRHESPRRQSRFTSPHRMDQKPQYQDDHLATMKNIRPAYESHAQAPNEVMYSGGYRPNISEEAIKYQSRSEHWKEREGFSSKTLIEDRRDGSRMQKFEVSRASERPMSTEQDANRSRSPVRDRFKRHSPSPRSPRRSWALEKRRSPEIREPPPPPMWPQDKEDYSPPIRPKFLEKELPKNSPIWETREKIRDTFQSSDERRNLPDERRPEVRKWKPIPGPSSQTGSSSLFEETSLTRKDFDNRRDLIRDDENRKLQVHPDGQGNKYRQEHSDMRYTSNFGIKNEMPRKRDEYSGHIEEKKKEILLKQEQLQKEIDEVYKRAADFTKKAEMYRKGDGNYDDDRRHSEDRANPKDMQRFQKRSYEDDRDRENFHRDYKNPQYNRNDDRKYIQEHFKKSRHGSDDTEKSRNSNQSKNGKKTLVEDILDSILSKHGKFLSGEMKRRVSEEMKWTLTHKVNEMFKARDLSYTEMVAKFNAKYTSTDQENLFKEVMFSLPNHYRNMERRTQDDYDVPAKKSRLSSEPSANKDLQSKLKEQIPDWNISLMQANLPMSDTSMTNVPFMATLPITYQHYSMPDMYKEEPQITEGNKKDCVLYLCKDDFHPILEYETELLKDFLVKELIKVTQTLHSWAPEFTLNKQNSDCRHEVVARDERSKDWLLSIDFSEFKHFNVLVYNTEELWYERAAIWLPGHSRQPKSFDPLKKLMLQNKHLAGVNIGKWKTVKLILTEKGSRLYVDMPPSSARALEDYKMLLSYELQKVNVFLKAVAVDKNAFDAGLNEKSLTNIPPGTAALMPSVGHHPDLVKMALKGNKPFTLQVAKKLRDIILYKLFKYQELGGKSRTDFLKYGFCQGGFFGVIPENEESKKWLVSLDLSRVLHQPVIIMGVDGIKTKYFKMRITMPRNYNLIKSALSAFERIRQSNQGVKGLNFSLWKNPKLANDIKRMKTVLEIYIDLESVETLMNLNFKLDYVCNRSNYGSLLVESEYSLGKLKEHIAKYKEEMTDSYDVSNMELATSSDDEVICLERPADRREPLKKPAAVEAQKYRMGETSSSTEKKNKGNIENKEIEKHQETESPTEEPEGQFQLNDLMTRILEEELKTIMIEVWQALPDDPPTDAEKFVTEKLRYEVSDDLRNVLGLNVTKRLLNIYNPLIVKLQFSCLPKIQIFAQFLKTFNVKTYRRFNKDFNIFVVRLTSITDFDKLCTDKNLRCGNAKVTATPIYKFSKCPEKLITIYNYNDEEESKVENKQYDDGEAKDADKPEIGDSKKDETKTNTKGQEKKIRDENVIEKNIIKTVKSEENKTQTEVEQNDSKSKITIDKEKDNKAIKTAVSDIKPKGKNVKRITTQTKNKITEPKKVTYKINKTNIKNEKTKITVTKKLAKQKEFLDEEIMEDEIQEFNTGDEMDDEEILALISEGVVVDECIGSDGE